MLQVKLEFLRIEVCSYKNRSIDKIGDTDLINIQSHTTIFFNYHDLLPNKHLGTLSHNTFFDRDKGSN